MTSHRASRGLSALLAAAPKALALQVLAPLVVFGVFSGCGQVDVGEIIDHIKEGHGHGGHNPPPAVCELDGVRYQPGESFRSPDGCNSCFCSENGQVGCTLRFCATICGGIQGLGCSEGEYCNFAPETRCGSGDQTGICATPPDFCTREFRPVCGCDGVTYGNACTAAAAGVSVAEEGACNSGPGCRADSDCPVPPCACLDENADGICENRCPVPVCRDGVCSVSQALQLGDSCGGFRVPNSGECDAGLFCQHQPGALCGAADAPGECVLIPDVCNDIFAPVCGCDGETYSNACEAAASQVGILDVGRCP